MKAKALLTGICAVLVFSISTPYVFANTRLQDARQVQQQVLTGELKSDRLNAVRSVIKLPAVQSIKQPIIVTDSAFINPTYGRFTSKFGWRDIGAGQEFHKGIDIANIIGTDIIAAAGGIVTHAKFMNGYGNVVIISHLIEGQVYATAYAHLSALNVFPGQEVIQGQSIAKMGNTGRSFGSHLHFEIHLGTWNGGRTNAVDPAQFISI